MSIKDISKEKKLEVFIRLLKSNEKFEIACSKSGLSKNDAKFFLAK